MKLEQKTKDALIGTIMMIVVVAALIWYVDSEEKKCTAKGGTLVPVQTSDWPYGCFKVEKIKP